MFKVHFKEKLLLNAVHTFLTPICKPYMSPTSRRQARC